ncbi:MAG: hypothetical protein JWM64_1953, partial [Frankiales bacterium]|nr:hypothetical protein [Frankiales bacterium]
GTAGGATTPGGQATTAGAPAGAAPGCGPLTATDRGVTAKTITVGVITVDLGTAGEALDLPSSADLRKAYGAVIDDVNAKGGVRCRKLVARFYNDSVLDASQEHAACLQMTEDKVFTVFNNFFTTQEAACIAKQKIPNIWYGPPHTADLQRYAPYILSWQPHLDLLIKHYVHGAQQQGFFSGMKKLGLLQGSCYPDENAAVRRELKSIGVAVGSTFDYGCDQAATPASKDQAAALQFQRDGVTHVVNVAYGNDAGFSRAADQQGYDPAFARMEDASGTLIENGAQNPGRSFDKTLMISTQQTGAGNTPGYQHGAATKECTRLLKGVGLPAPYAAPSAVFFGIACVNVAMFKDMAERAPSLVRTQLATGLSRVGQKDLSLPSGPAIFNSAALPTGGQQWRPVVYATACQCWRVKDARFRPGY